MPEGREQEVIEGIRRGMYLLRERSEPKRRSRPPGAAPGQRDDPARGEAAAELLEQDFGVAADVWSATSFTELARDGLDADRWTMLHPGQEPRIGWVTQQLAGRPAGPVVAATDYMRAFAEQIRPQMTGTPVPGAGHRRFRPLGLPGALRRHFEVDRHHVVLAALTELAAEGGVPLTTVTDAITRYGIDADKPNPARV